MMTAKQFRAALTELGFSRRAFADRLGLHPNTVSAWAQGHVAVPGYAAEYLRVMRLLQQAWQG